MKEYKIIKQKFSWSGSNQAFEDRLNTYAKQGWQVINVHHNGAKLQAVLERAKNR